MSGLKRPGQPGRHKGHLLASDLIPLGSKGATTRQASPNPSAPPPSKKPHLQVPDEASNSGGLFTDPIKLSQVGVGGAGGSGTKPLGGVSGTSGSGIKPLVSAGTKLTPPPTGVSAIEVRPADLVAAVKDALTTNNAAKAEKLMCGAIKQLKNARLKADIVLNNALTTIALEHTDLLSLPSVVEGLIAVLKKESSAIYKTRKEPVTYALACQLLLAALGDSYSWPESVAKVYIEDAFGDRVWVEFDSCQKLIDNICSIFNTRGQGQVGGGKAGESVQSDTKAQECSAGVSGGVEQMKEEEEEKMEKQGSLETFLQSVEVSPRFSMKACNVVCAQVRQMITDQLGRRAPPTNETLFRNQLKFLVVAAGMPEVRLLVAQHFEQWVQNTKLTKLLHELLSAVAINCHQHTEEDVKVIETLVGLRLKTRLFSAQYISCIKELISSHPDNLPTALKTVVHNELTQTSRGSPNMSLLTMMLHNWPDEAALLLGEMFQNFLAHKEDYLRPLRVFLREQVRQVKVDLFPFTAFTRALMQERKEATFTSLDHSLKERMALSLADLISCCCMLTANILIREAYAGYSKGEKAMISQLKEFFDTLGVVQRDAVWWVHTVLPNFLRPQPSNYKLCLRKVLFLEPADSYIGKDGWPTDSDRQTILHLMNEASLQGDTLLRVLVIGLTRELPLSPSDALDIADKLVARAANAHTSGIPKLPNLDRKELFNAIFDITTYRPPASIQLPSDYTPPDLAISKLYWKGWILLLVLAAYNPKTIGSVGWSEYPTLRAMMEMVTTNNYMFPSSMTLAVSHDGVLESSDSAIAQELQLSRMEKESILEYEKHLASSSNQNAVITEANSYLLNQVTLRDPKGPARRLIPSVVELVKTVNKSLRLGQLLCQCREPDFLLSIIQRQGTERSMGWLKELVEGSSHSSLEALPVPCLCEFLISSYQEMRWVGPDGDHTLSSHRIQHKKKQKMKEKTLQQHHQLVERLRTMLVDPSSSSSSVTSDVLQFFLEKLTHSQLTSRNLALRALKEILTSASSLSSSSSSSSIHLFSDTEEDDSAFSSQSISTDPLAWLLVAIPSLPHFPVLSSSISSLITRACRVETSLILFLGYLVFLTTHAGGDDMIELMVELSSTIVRRFTIIKKVIHSQPTSAIQPVTTIGDLLSMLRSVLSQFLFQQRPIPTSVPEDSVVLVVFPAAGVGEVVLPHSLVEAILLLLPLVKHSQCRDYLMKLFFPSDQLPPRVVSMTTKEPIPLVSSKIWAHILCSSNSTLTRGVVKYLTPPQLCHMIQLSGVKDESVEILLEELDCLSDTPVLFREGLRDIATLMECVHARMVKARSSEAGMKFLTYLQGQIKCSPSLPSSLDELLALSTAMLPEHDADRMDTHSSSLPPSPSCDVMSELVTACFSSSSTFAGHKLIKYLQELSTGCRGDCSARLEFIMSTILNLVTSSSNKTLISTLARNPSSPLLFSLLTKLARQYQVVLHSLRTVVTTIMDTISMDELPSMFSLALQSCSRQIGDGEHSDTSDQAAIIMREVKEMKIEQALVTCNDMVRSGNVMVEDVMVGVARRAVMEGGEKDTFRLLTSLISSLPPLPPPPHSLSHSPVTSDRVPMDSSLSGNVPTLSVHGLACDLLEVLDPNLLQLCPADGRKVIFGGKSTSETGSVQQSYLLARVVHQSSWCVVRETITALLNRHCCSDQDMSIIPGAVLDMLWACLHCPSLWQGRVKKEAVINSNLSLGIDEQSHLILTPSQLKCLLDYVLDEAAHVNKSDDVGDAIFSRLPLVVSCCSHGSDLLAACKHLLEQADQRSSLAWLLLVQLYHADQRVVGMVGTRSQRLARASLVSPLPTRVDTQLHHLLSTMTSSSPDKESVKKMTAASLLCRHIAITHPALLLRHLSMLGWLLRGRAHLTSKQFQLNNHQHVFNNVFHLLELLQPVIFDMEEPLNCCLEPLFDFLQLQCVGHQKTHSLISKMASFLLQYLYHNRQAATAIITQNLSTIRSLSEVLPKHKAVLQPLLDIVPLESSSSDGGSSTGLDPLLPGGPTILLSPATGQQHSYQQLLPFLKKLERGQAQESISRVLQDLDDSSLRSVEILNHFVPELCRLIQDPAHSSKELSHDLLLRHLRHNPSSVHKVLPALQVCLESHDYSVVTAAVGAVCDVALLCEAPQATLLLTKLFRLSLHPSLNCSAELLKTVNTFTIHSFT